MQVKYLSKNSELKGQVEDFIKEWNNSSTSIVVKTSGSTGPPKSIEINKEDMKNSARITGEFLGLKKGDTALLCLSPTTIAGKMMIVRSIVLELNLVIGELSSNPLKNLNFPLDFIAMVPYQISTILSESPEKLKLLGKTIIGGGVINKELENVLSLRDEKYFQTFGMTETISHIAMREVGVSEDYQLLNGVSIAVNNEDCLVISAPNLGVYNLITNDIVEITEKGFKWLGRKDFVINSGGIKMHPEHIEAQLSPLIITPYFSIGIDDDILGTKHILCIESEETALNRKLLEKVLSKYEIPKSIYLFDSFVYTDSGKVDRLNTLKTKSYVEREVL